MSFFENTRKPVGFGGKVMTAMMNIGHKPVAHWGLQFLKVSSNAKILDCGCGGGANIKKLLKKYPHSIVNGIDYSIVSVEKSKKVNNKAVAEGRCTVLKGNVMNMPYSATCFDAVTAFETIYFWPDIVEDFKEVRRVLKPGGRFAVCNEMASETGNERWISLLDMKIYTPDEIVENMTKAGFTQTSVFTQGNRICVIGHK